jgi:hypothetical protein
MIKEYSKQNYIELLFSRNRMIMGIAESKKAYSHVIMSGRMNILPLNEFIKKMMDHLMTVEEEIVEYKMKFPEAILNNWESSYIDTMREGLEKERLFIAVAKETRDIEYLDGGEWNEIDNGNSEDNVILGYITVHDPVATVDTVKEDYANEHGLMYGSFEVREIISLEKE